MGHSYIVSPLGHQSWRCASTWTSGRFLWWSGVPLLRRWQWVSAAWRSRDSVAGAWRWMSAGRWRHLAPWWCRWQVQQLWCMDPCSEDESEEDGGGDFWAHVVARAEGMLDGLVLPARCWTTWRGLRCYDDVCWCDARAIGTILGHPFISLVGLVCVARMVASYWSLYSLCKTFVNNLIKEKLCASFGCRGWGYTLHFEKRRELGKGEENIPCNFSPGFSLKIY
jgi:hypothetical protein